MLYREKVWENVPKLNRSVSNQKCHNTENSFEPHSSDEGYDSNSGIFRRCETLGVLQQIQHYDTCPAKVENDHLK